MKPLTSNQIRGNWATLLSVWNADDSLDLNRVSSEIDILISMNVDGIYSNGTAGEFYSQSEFEFDQISKCLAEKCNSAGMPFQIGISHMSAKISLDRLRRVVPLAPGAVQLILPDWYPVSNEEAVNFLEKMAEEACGIGLVLYNPPHAKRVLSPIEVGYLAKRVPGLIGLKTAGGDEQWFASMRKHIPNLSVFVPGHLLASGVQRGAQGSYSNVACLNPLSAQKWSDQTRADISAALELEKRVSTFVKTYISPFITEHGYCSAACDRFMALLGGWADVSENMRWPYRAIPSNEIKRIRPVAEELIPEFFKFETSW
jgi:dihydrodipicolinate synthase/N-acetylneuraminate lyase